MTQLMVQSFFSPLKAYLKNQSGDFAPREM
jgi:hypothetical protein